MRNRVARKKRPSHKTFLVICEGETERVYIETLKQHYRLPIAIRTKVSGNCINARLVAQYLRELGLSDKSEYRVFYVYDCDVEPVVEKLSKLEGTAVLTNPCLEFWFLLHIEDFKRLVSSEAVVKRLSEVHESWKHYTKGALSREQRMMLMNNCNRAIERADKLTKHANPSSDFPIFIRALESEQNC